MPETFEDRMRAKRRSHGQGINRTAFIGFSDAVLIAIEADAALAARQQENISIKEVMVEQARKIEHLTALNIAKDELIEYLSLQTFSMDDDERALRARIRSLENE